MKNWFLACIYWFDITSSLPVINEDQAREALLQYVAQNCCYGSGAAKKYDLQRFEVFISFPCMNAMIYL